MSWLTQLIGVGLVLLAIIDIFMTVLYPRSGKGWLSVPLSQAIWMLFRRLANLPPWKGTSNGDRILTFCGPVLLVTIVMMWIGLLLYGFAFIFWAALGQEIQNSEGATPRTLTTALYYSGYSLTTVGFGDLVPTTDSYRLLTILESALGFSVFTLTITYLVAVYGALRQRNIFALGLYHGTAHLENAAELLARLGICGSFNNSRQDIAQMSSNGLMLLESHHAYPVLPYFRFKEAYYALARIALIMMDTATLLKSALNQEAYRSLLNSPAVAELEHGGQHLLVELINTLSLQRKLPLKGQPDTVLRAWYYQAIERLNQEGIATVSDLEAGAELYISLRRQWEPYVLALADYMAYDWCEIAPAECGYYKYSEGYKT